MDESRQPSPDLVFEHRSLVGPALMGFFGVLPQLLFLNNFIMSAKGLGLLLAVAVLLVCCCLGVLSIWERIATRKGYHLLRLTEQGIEFHREFFFWRTLLIPFEDITAVEYKDGLVTKQLIIRVGKTKHHFSDSRFGDHMSTRPGESQFDEFKAVMEERVNCGCLQSPPRKAVWVKE